MNIDIFYNFLTYKFYLGGVILISFIFIDSYLSRSLLKSKEKSIFASSESEKKYKLFEYKYLKEYKELKEKVVGNNVKEVYLSEEDFNKLKENILEEDTPRGLVKLWYNNDVKAFLYYSNTIIPYKYLETVARHFVIINNCPSIFIDYCHEILIAREKWLDIKNIDEEEKKENMKKVEESSIFASFKNYKQNDISAQDSNVIIPEMSNKYIYKGKLNLFLEGKEKKEKENIFQQDYKSVSFKDFKKLD